MKFYFTYFTLLFVIFQSCDESVSEPNIPALTQELNESSTDWQWVDVEGMQCRDGSETGIAIRLGSNTSKWVFYLEGGGACFTPATCESNPANFNESDFLSSYMQDRIYTGIFNNTKNENPVKDWNMIYIPYCTGDVHVGNKPNGTPLGGSEKQQYVGNRNMLAVIKLVKPYLQSKNLDELLVTGISAGGFGTHIAGFNVKQAFPNVKMNLINDSGPLISDPEVFPICLNLGFQFLFAIPLPPGLLFCCNPAYGLADSYTFSNRLFPDANFGLISHLEDQTIRYFFAAGQNTCTGGEISGPKFKQGLQHLRENVLKPTNNWGTFYLTGDAHTFLVNDDRFYNAKIGDTYLYEWMQKTMQGEVIHLEQ